MDHKPFFWEIMGSPYPSNFLRDSQKFGETNPIYLIDQFSGKRPALFNKKFISTGKVEFPMYACAILDSNIIDAIDKKVSNNATFDGLDSFLRFLIKDGWDFNLLFYYLEHYAKSSISDFKKNAIRRTESLLKLHSMDEKFFLTTGKISSNLEAVNHYTQQAGVKNLAEVAESRVISFIGQWDKRALVNMTELTQIALIKMVLIHKYEQPQSSAIKKYNELVRFLRVDVGIMLARESHIGLHYFCDLAGKLLGIQSNTSIERALSIIKSTAWDIFLLRMPEALFSENPDELCIAYIATHEKSLQNLANLFTIESIKSTPSGFVPRIGYSMVGIDKSISENIAKDIDEPEAQTDFRIKKSFNSPTGLLSAMEAELRRFCSN